MPLNVSGSGSNNSAVNLASIVQPVSSSGSSRNLVPIQAMSASGSGRNLVPIQAVSGPGSVSGSGRNLVPIQAVPGSINLVPIQAVPGSSSNNNLVPISGPVSSGNLVPIQAVIQAVSNSGSASNNSLVPIQTMSGSSSSNCNLVPIQTMSGSGSNCNLVPIQTTSGSGFNYQLEAPSGSRSATSMQYLSQTTPISGSNAKETEVCDSLSREAPPLPSPPRYRLGSGGSLAAVDVGGEGEVIGGMGFLERRYDHPDFRYNIQHRQSGSGQIHAVVVRNMFT